MIGILLQKMGVSTALNKDLPSLREEGIVFRQDNTFVILKFKEFRGPNSYFLYKVKGKFCTIILSKSRIYCCGWLFRVVNLPYTKANSHFFRVERKGARICLSVCAKAFGDRYSGDFFMSFSSPKSAVLDEYFSLSK